MNNKKYFFFFFVLLALVAAQHAFAQGFVPLAPIPGLTGEGDVSATTEGLPAFFNNLYKLLIGVAALAAIIQIMRSGIELALNQGSVSEILSAKGRVAQAIYGLVLVLIPALVFGIINPNILNLSVSLPDITYTERAFQGERVSTTVRGVHFEIRGTYLQNAVFSSPDKERVEAEATLYIESCENNGVFSRILSGDTLFTRNPVAVCRDGYNTDGSCAGEFSVSAQCAQRSETPFTFVVVGGRGTSDPYQFRAANPENFDSFKSVCSRDGGQTCVIKSGFVSTLGVRTQNVACPEALPFTIPPGAPDASDGGKCQRSYVVCSPPDVAERKLCSEIERIVE